MNKIIDQLKRDAEENPLATLAVAGMVATALAKLWQARNDALGRRIYAQEVQRRIMQGKRR